MRPDLKRAEIEHRLGDAIQTWVDLGDQADANHRLLQASAADVPVLLNEIDRLSDERDAAVAALDPVVIAAEQAELDQLRAEVRRLNGLRPGRLPCGHTCGYPGCDGAAPPEVAAVVDDTVRAWEQHRDEVITGQPWPWCIRCGHACAPGGPLNHPHHALVDTPDGPVCADDAWCHRLRLTDEVTA